MTNKKGKQQQLQRQKSLTRIVAKKSLLFGEGGSDGLCNIGISRLPLII
jgi:hypothetical protein